MLVRAWTVHELGRPMTLAERDESPGAGEVLVAVAGCGVCHTDLGFFYEGVPTRHALPLTLGHEISGEVVVAGPGAESWLGRRVVVPAVIPCGECPACVAGRGAVCPGQIFPGNDVHGGFATHVRLPARGLCPVPDLANRHRNPAGLDLATLSVIADAVSTAYQAVLRSELGDGDLAVFVGVGGVGGFGAQIAASRGAAVVGIDTDPAQLERLAGHGLAEAVVAGEGGFKAIKNAVKVFAKRRGIPTWRWRIFETSGTRAGQETAYGLLGHGGYLSVVGFTTAKIELRLANLMAFDAQVQGVWGCLPEHYPAIVELALSGKIAVSPFVDFRPLSTINDTFAELHSRGALRRIILLPDA